MEERIKLIQGDITTLQVDAVVNAANTSLLGGGGVDGAIHRAAGPGLVEICRLLGGCEVGEAKVTPGLHLPAKYIIHTVGPVWKEGSNEESEKLANCYRSCLEQARLHDFKTLAFPNISTGVYHFPKQLAAEIAVRETKAFLASSAIPESVTFVCFDKENFDLYKALLNT
ncbi:MAG: O-acetyl-ADP-ribose deacetylase [Bacteroidetes bacterium]|nr:O-acetyl-ADP-ribose deacetylase [Bacteroidota bacterium]